MDTKNFDAYVDSMELPTFVVGGQKFTARKKLPWKTLQAFINSTGQSEMEAATTFFGKALVPADRQRFMDLLDLDGEHEDSEDLDEDSVISFIQMNELIRWMMDYYTGKEAPKDENS